LGIHQDDVPNSLAEIQHKQRLFAARALFFLLAVPRSGYGKRTRFWFLFFRFGCVTPPQTPLSDFGNVQTAAFNKKGEAEKTGRHTQRQH